MRNAVAEGLLALLSLSLSGKIERAARELPGARESSPRAARSITLSIGNVILNQNHGEPLCVPFPV